MSTSIAAKSVSSGASLRDWYVLTKPRITLLVLVTTYSGMWLAYRGTPGFWVTFWTLLGTGLASAASCTMNNAFDQGIDQLMTRTLDRPVAAGRISPEQAMVFGVVLGVASITILLFGVNEVVASLAVFTIAFYVLIYTMWLKRTSPLCTSVGGIAGAMPPVMGWVAIRPELEYVPLALFAVMFLWQPPHFYALALARREEYAKAKIPMFPVVHGVDATRKRMIVWTSVTVAATLIIWVTGLADWVFGFTAMIFGGLWLKKTVVFAQEPYEDSKAMKLFGFSLIYLTAVYIAFVFDVGT